MTTRDFSRDAATWDENPVRVRLALDVAAAIRAAVPLAPAWEALDFGCGTGLLTLALAPDLRRIVGVDNAPGMLEVLRAKVARLGLANVAAEGVDLEKAGQLPGTYDLVTSAMCFHHVCDTAALLAALVAGLRPGGWLAVADLDPDGGLFHPDRTGVFHDGFDRAELARQFAAAGLAEVQARTAATIARPGADGQTHAFTVFLLSGRKPALP